MMKYTVKNRSMNKRKVTLAKRMYLAAALALCLMALTACQSADPQSAATAIPTASPSPIPTATPAPNQTSNEAPDAQVGLQNPIVNVSGAGDFAALGLVMRAPEGVENVRYAVISGEVAQIEFTYGGAEYTLRGSRTLTDIAGVYDAFEEEAQAIDMAFDAKSLSVRIARTKTGGVLSQWNLDGATFTLWAASGSDEDTMGALALECAMSAGVQ